MALRVGTRASALATTQTGHVVDQLAGHVSAPIETVHIRTEGDVATGSLTQMGGTGVFVTALREAVLDGRCDIAVHSLKDLPTAQVPGLTIVTPLREDARDALCSRGGAGGLSLQSLPAGARIGTGSPRRAAQVLSRRPDVTVVDIRGNVDTRLRRVTGPDADLDAVVLAASGLARLGRSEVVTQLLDVAMMVPAAGQGALAVEFRTGLLDDPELSAAFAAINHIPTYLAVTAERALLGHLEAGCAAPVGAHSWLADDGLSLSAVVARPDGTERYAHTAWTELPPIAALTPPTATTTGSLSNMARSLGERVAEELLSQGAGALIP